VSSLAAAGSTLVLSQARKSMASLRVAVEARLAHVKTYAS
jgi:hypothetical protein